jgi:hypothetical protein
LLRQSGYENIIAKLAAMTGNTEAVRGLSLL